ncbi:MAG: cytochrome c oxidase assembly protein [Gammaproteobacteria bacterium]|nr:cytochrome c oxidase assembly protein [Gammaproteobacteria bacterium]
MSTTGPRQGHRQLAGRLALLAVAMFGFGYLLVPLYDILCEVTGIGNRTGTPTADVVVEVRPDTSRTITVEFVANLNQYAPWEFQPATAMMEVHPGQFYDTTYFARNLTDRKLVGQAVPSVAPGQANKFFKKVECFCFTSQEFAAQEGRDMGLRFMVDPDLPAYIDRITLSYTFFANQNVALNTGAPR